MSDYSHGRSLSPASSSAPKDAAILPTNAMPELPNPVIAPTPRTKPASSQVAPGLGVLTVAGFSELTAANAIRFKMQVCAVLNGHSCVEIDLSRTTFMDCTGLGALIALSNLTRGRNCVLRLVNPTPPVRRLFDIVRLGTVFEIVVSQLPEASDLCQSTDA